MNGTAMQVFDFGDLPVRVISREAAPWFVAADVCRILEIANSRDAVAGLDEDEKGVAIADTRGGAQKTQIISESGLYALIFKSRKAEAKRFRKWVTAEVLPAIRTSGGYRAETIDQKLERGAVEIREMMSREIREIEGQTDRAMAGLIEGQMRAGQATALVKLVQRRIELVRLRMGLWLGDDENAPWRRWENDWEVAHRDLEPERKGLGRVAMEVFLNAPSGVARLDVWREVAVRGGHLPELLHEEMNLGQQRKALSRVLARWDGGRLGNGLVARIVHRRNRSAAEWLVRAEEEEGRAL